MVGIRGQKEIGTFPKVIPLYQNFKPHFCSSKILIKIIQLSTKWQLGCSLRTEHIVEFMGEFKKKLRHKLNKRMHIKELCSLTLCNFGIRKVMLITLLDLLADRSIHALMTSVLHLKLSLNRVEYFLPLFKIV